MEPTPLNIKRQVETGIKELIAAKTYVTSNSLPVLKWFDNDTEVVGQQIIVHALPEVPSLIDESGEAQEYEVQIDLLQYIHNSEDETPTGSSETDTIYEFLMGFLRDVTKAEIQAKLTGLTVNGKQNGNSVEEYDERFYQKAGTIILYIEINQTT